MLFSKKYYSKASLARTLAKTLIHPFRILHSLVKNSDSKCWIIVIKFTTSAARRRVLLGWALNQKNVFLETRECVSRVSWDDSAPEQLISCMRRFLGEGPTHRPNCLKNSFSIYKTSDFMVFDLE
mgnify:CR=1 FL=1